MYELVNVMAANKMIGVDNNEHKRLEIKPLKVGDLVVLYFIEEKEGNRVLERKLVRITKINSHKEFEGFLDENDDFEDSILQSIKEGDIIYFNDKHISRKQNE